MVAVEQVDGLLDVYRRYVAKALYDTAEQSREAAAKSVRLAEEGEAAAAKHGALLAKHAKTREDLAAARERDEVLGATIEGIKESDLYRAGLDMENLARNVSSLGRVADTALNAAGARRAEEVRTVGRTDGQADAVVAATERAASVLAEAKTALRQARLPAGTFPADITVVVVPGEQLDELVRQSLDEPPVRVIRPAPRRVTLSPDDLAGVASTVQDVSGVASRRSGEARNRLETAQELSRREVRTTDAEANAERLAQKAEDDAERAATAADERDDEARALAAEWRRWTAADRTREVLGEVEWSGTPAGALLLDADTLTGALEDNEDLRRLDAIPNDVAQTAREAIAGDRASIRRVQEEDDESRAELVDERRRLLGAEDPEPPNVPWARGGPPGSEPLWRTVDFADQVTEPERAGLEAALLSSGLLSASVTADGTVRAEDGQVLLTFDAPVAARSLRAMLRWDSASGLPEELVTGILTRIGVGEGHSTWVDVDGRWRTGPLHGKYGTDRARFVGTAARAAARAERLEQIAAELAELDERDAQRGRELERLDALAAELRSYLHLAPKSDSLRDARSSARTKTAAANSSQREAGEALNKAREMRSALITDRKAHGDQCARLGLPVDAASLREVEQGAEEAKRSCQRLVERVGDLRNAFTTHGKSVGEIEPAAEDRRDAEDAAEQAWKEWHHEAVKLSALEDAVGKDFEEKRRELHAAEDQRKQTGREMRRLDEAERELDRAAASARTEAAHAEEEAVRGARDAAEQHDLLMSQVAVPGVLDAATRGGFVDIEGLGALDAATRIQQVVDRGGAAVGENALMRAVQSVGNELTNTLDLDTSREAGVWLVELIDAAGRQPVAVAAANLREQADRAAEALTSREQKVFTDFVVGGVGEELRRRLSQADLLLKAMNASLSGIRTSHNIGVLLKWELTEPKGSPIARIRDLVKASSKVRPVEETEELIRLLKERVDDQFALEADAGYSTHLSTALDYRQWHRVEVFILGPAPNQERKISRRAKLSQGETRFVSYVALFAAADAYLSGLPDTGLALRLILLDDAFAKVDERTIGELMGLLVRLDLDFCMTGHALWGTYEQVPSVDVYEIRRAEGTAAVATHVHWDGHNRHFLRSTSGS
jgi:uncharacterized protein (TIGR02680 family)